MATLVLLVLSLVIPSNGQLMYYYLYPSYYPTTPTLQQNPAYTTQQYICGTPNNYQYQATPCTSSNYNPNCDTECQSTPYCQRFDANAACVNGCCNSTLSNSNSNLYNPNQQSMYGVARDNGINDISCPFNDPSAGSCIDGNCPSGFVCNAENVCCPCSVGAPQGVCSAGSCSSSALQCERASGMCCPRPLNASASATGAYQQQSLPYTLGLQQQPKQPFGSQQLQAQQPYQQQYRQEGNQFPQQQFNQQNQYNNMNQQNQFPQQQQQLNGQNQNQFQQQFGNQNQYNAQNQNQFQQLPNLNGQSYSTPSPNQFNQPQSSQNLSTSFVYNTQNPNPSSSSRFPQASTTTIPTIYPSNG